LVTNLALICFIIGDLDFDFLDLGDSYFEEFVTMAIMFAILFLMHCFMSWKIASRPHSIGVHMQRQDHLEFEIKAIGAGIERYLDSMTSDKLKNWDRWQPEEVALFLREMCYKNPEEFRPLKKQIVHARFDGATFAGCNEHILEKRLDIKDPQHMRFIFNARRVLKKVQQRVKKEEELFTMEDSVRGGLGGGRDKEQFDFTDDHLIQMAEFFEADLTGQSKRKLWTKVDKDQSALIEQNEMENFLYFSIVVYIKARYDNVRLPKKSDKRFQKKVLQRLKKWLLHYKVSAQGLTFQEFDQFFPAWLREYHREMKAEEAGQLSKYHTINVDAQNDRAIGSTLNYNTMSSVDGGDDLAIARKKLKEDQNRKTKQSKLAGMLGADAAIKNDGIDRSQWTGESKEWEGKLASVAKAVQRTDKGTRGKIWDKFDRKGAGKLDLEKSLSRLIYSFFALYTKTRDRDGKPPKFQTLQGLLSSLCADIKRMINEASGKETRFITKQDFVDNIADYLSKIAAQRK